MRVLFLTDSLSDLDGVGRYAMRLIAALEELEPGLEVEVLLARKHRPTSKQVPSHWRVRVALPPDYFFYMSRPRFYLWWALGVLRSYRAARRADLVHAIKDFPHNLVALSVARLARRPCLATAHGTYTIQPLLDPRHAARARKTYRGFARMISVSHYTERRLCAILEKDGFPTQKLAVIPNAVSAEHYARKVELAPKPWHGARFTLSIGEIKERKGHHLALEAFCQVAAGIPDLKHFIVGKCPRDAYEARLRELVRRAGLEQRVFWLGNVSEEEKVDLLQRAQVFVHTPVTAQDGGFEGFGIVYLEAAAAGLPAIGTRDCGAEDAIVDGTTGFLVEQNVAAVAAALRRLLAEAGLRQAMGQAAHEHAGRSSWRENARRVLALYHEVLSR